MSFHRNGIFKCTYLVHTGPLFLMSLSVAPRTSPFQRLDTGPIALHHHLSLNHEGHWGTKDDFITSFLHFSLFSTALWDLVNSEPVHSLTLFAHFFGLPCLLPPFTVPCKMTLARLDEQETCSYHFSLSLYDGQMVFAVWLPAGYLGLPPPRQLRGWKGKPHCPNRDSNLKTCRVQCPKHLTVRIVLCTCVPPQLRSCTLQMQTDKLRTDLFVKHFQKTWCQTGVCLLCGHGHLQPLFDWWHLSFGHGTEVAV